MRIMHLSKHVDNTDVAIMVLKHPVFIPEKNGYKIKVTWFNIVNPKNVFSLQVTETIFVKKEDIAKWRPYEPQLSVQA